MRKVLLVFLALFLGLDALLAYTLFSPGSTGTNLFQSQPGACLVLDTWNCQKIQKVRDSFGNTLALYPVSKGTKIFAPANGTVGSYVTPKLQGSPKNSAGLSVFLLSSGNGVSYYLMFDPQNKPSSDSREVKKGELIAVTSGKQYPYLKNNTLGITVKKDGSFAKDEFEKLFR